MKRWIAFTGILILGAAAIVVTERRKVEVRASPAALLNFVADSERELTRMPMDFTRMPDEEEIRIGDELAAFYAGRQQGEKPSSEDEQVSAYLTEVGTRVAGQAHRKLPYKFHYIPQAGMVNAFALPGGHVFIGAGILALMESEDELAAVLGHELEHIDHYHCAERIQIEVARRHLPFGDIVSLPVQLFEVGYSKDQELEADREGTRLAEAAGYSANGAMRMFATFGRLQEEYQNADKSPQDEAARVAQQTLEGYFRSHPLPAERIAQIQQLIASEGWSVRSERDLKVTFVFMTAKAQEALERRKYEQAEELAKRSLQLRAGQPKALAVLAEAQVSQANFVGAADTYLTILQLEPGNARAIGCFARALAAVDSRSALSEFEKWESGAAGEKALEVKVEEAGLALLSGKSENAQRLESELIQAGSAEASKGLGELGWWHYLAGEYPRAVELLGLAVQRIPGNAKWRQELAWAEIEVKRYSDALQILDNLLRGPEESEAMMARAVARWRAAEKEDAMTDFDEALAVAKEEWQEPRLIKILYSPMTAKNIAEMWEEAQRRRANRGVKP